MRRQKETYKLITANTAKINNASSISIIISKLKKNKGELPLSDNDRTVPLINHLKPLTIA